MKFTTSRDGVRRCDLRIAVRMGRDDIIDALAASTSEDRLDDLPQTISAAEMWTRTREAIARFGESASYWAENRDDADEIRDWATANVDRILKAKL